MVMYRNFQRLLLFFASTASSHSLWRCLLLLLVQLEAKHNDAVAASQAHSQEMSKQQVSLHLVPVAIWQVELWG